MTARPLVPATCLVRMFSPEITKQPSSVHAEETVFRL